MKAFLVGFAVPLLGLNCLNAAQPPPAPFGAVPSARQLAWHKLEAYAFVHFTVNTFTDREWGYGDESPETFNPTDFSADQIVGAVKAGGLKGLILTCKHHDGFALWPSRFSRHTIAQSPYKNGKGDIVREISDACSRAGIKFGIYLSPWDRNHADYGKPAYIDYYRHQLRELLTQYGPVFEVWFDGANGGDGYYGGARETRKIDNTSYYDWENTWKMVRELQPEAVLFSDGGPDARWIGNEKGKAGEPCWATLDAKGFYPGFAERLDTGDRNGESWLPAEVDISLRPGWFFHASEDVMVKSPEELFSIYLDSVGRGANLILNLTPDRRGRIPDRDVAHIASWQRMRRETFGKNLASGATISASNTRGEDPSFGTARLLDGDRESYWATDDAVRESELIIDLVGPRSFDLVQLAEPLTLGQRIWQAKLDYFDSVEETWKEFATVTSVGSQRLVPCPMISTSKVRVRVTRAGASPALSEFGLYLRARP